MTTLQYTGILIGFALWFYAGYKIGKTQGFKKWHKHFSDIVLGVNQDKKIKQ